MLLLAVLLIGVLAAVKLLGHVRRRAALRGLEGDTLLRLAPHVAARLALWRTGPVLGLLPGRTHALRVDLALTDDRLLLATDAGVLLDLHRSQAAMLRSARCTGPGRLVLEGALGEGTWRLDVVVHDAEAWAAQLASWHPQAAELRYASFSARAG
jgi:hypothetical protein